MVLHEWFFAQTNTSQLETDELEQQYHVGFTRYSGINQYANARHYALLRGLQCLCIAEFNSLFSSTFDAPGDKEIQDFKGSIKKVFRWLKEIRLSYTNLFYRWTVLTKAW